MSEELVGDAATGIDRRDFIRKSALVGGMVWAAPMISSAPAFAATVTPSPGTTTDPVETKWSFWAAALACQKVGCPDCTEFKLKIKYQGGKFVSEGDWEDTPGEAPSCEPDGWGGTGVNGEDLGFVVEEGGEYWDVFFPDIIPFDGASCEVVDAKAKTGTDEGPVKPGGCGIGVKISPQPPKPKTVAGTWFRYANIDEPFAS